MHLHIRYRRMCSLLGGAESQRTLSSRYDMTSFFATDLPPPSLTLSFILSIKASYLVPGLPYLANDNIHLRGQYRTACREKHAESLGTLILSIGTQSLRADWNLHDVIIHVAPIHSRLHVVDP